MTADNQNLVNKFSFQCNALRGTKLFFIYLIYIPIGFFAKEITEQTSLGFFVILCVVIFIGVFIAVLIKSMHTEEVIVDKNGIDSKLHGFIDYSTIKDIELYHSIWKPIGMKLVLQNDQKIKWLVRAEHKDQYTNKNAIQFYAFVNALQSQLDKKYSHTKSSIPISKDNEIENKRHESDIVAINPAQKLKQDSEKIPSSKKWAATFSILFSILLFVKACGPGIIKKLRHNPDFSKMYAITKDLQDQKLRKAKLIADSIFRNSGKVFLYTNDINATIVAAPNLPEDPYSSVVDQSSMVANLMNDEEKINIYLEKSDSLGIVFLIKNDDNSEHFLMLKKGGTFSYIENSSSFPKMIFAVQDTSLHVIPLYEKKKAQIDSAQYPTFTYQNTFEINPHKNMTENIHYAAPGMKMMFANAHFRPAFKLYFLGQEKDGFTKEIMLSIMHAINLQSNKSNLDSSNIQLRVFNN